ncbi:hypothetical protein A6C57_01150 [Fibrella sp. ES10-3-2-2]|nr:hypothetical protein A6C57_01150 [Fibrella sp. ES10-3-2-2]
MKPIPTYGPDVFTINFTQLSAMNKQAFRYWGNEIFDHGYCEPIGAGIHVYTVQLATLFGAKTVELRDQDGKKKYCVGFKQVQYYRAGYDAGRAWFQKMYADPAQYLYGEGSARFVKQIHDLAFHKKTLFDVPDRSGFGVYGAKLINVPVNRRALRWAGYYAAITAGIIEMVTRHTSVFHIHETCAQLAPGSSATMATMRKRLEMGIIDKLPICEQCTYAIERQPKIPIDLTDLINVTTRVSESRTVSREQLPDYLTPLGFVEVFDFAPEPARTYLNEKPGLTSLMVHIGEDGLKLRHGLPTVEHTYWEGDDPTELLNQILAHANNLQNS